MYWGGGGSKSLLGGAGSSGAGPRGSPVRAKRARSQIQHDGTIRPVAGFSMTHIKGSKCAMISRAPSTSTSPSKRRQRAAVFRADRAVERRVVPAPDVAQDGGLKFRQCPGRSSPPPRKPCPESRHFKEQDHRHYDEDLHFIGMLAAWVKAHFSLA